MPYHNRKRVFMRLRSLSIICAMSALTLTTTACTEAELASHVIKQVPASSQSKTQGKFKVGSPYRIKGKKYYPAEMYEYVETGEASWYGPGFHNKQTANGEVFNKYDMTAAHRTLQLPSIIRVTNLDNGRSAILRVNDRGPFAHDRILDVSEQAATVLGFKNKGKTHIKLELLPQESRVVADAAKQGRDTRGIEIAMNKRYQQSRGINEEVQVVSNTPNHNNQQRVISTYSDNPVYETRPTVQSAPLPQNIAPVIDGGHYVQVASLSSRANAEKLSRELSDLGPVTVQPAMKKGIETYRVKIGPLADIVQAENVMPNISQRGFPDAWIVRSQ